MDFHLAGLAEAPPTAPLEDGAMEAEEGDSEKSGVIVTVHGEESKRSFLNCQEFIANNVPFLT